MRQKLSLEDERHLLIRSLSVNYSAGYVQGFHAHAWPQFLYTRKGAIRAEIDHVIWMTPPRRGLWIPAAKPHKLRMLGAVELRTLYIRPTVADRETMVRVVDVPGLLHEAILRTCDLQQLDGRQLQEQRLADLIIDEIKDAGSASICLSLPTDPRARRLAERMLDTDPGEAELDALYVSAGLSRRTAERLFEKETGLPPGRWRRLALLTRGMEALAAGAAIQAAADAAGYRSRAAFSDAFAKTFGFSPGTMRQLK